MKIDLNSLKKDYEKPLFLAMIIAAIVVVIISCSIEYQRVCASAIILSMFVNLVTRKEDSEFTQIRTPLLTCIALIANKVKTTLCIVFKPESINKLYKSFIDSGEVNLENLSFENSWCAALILVISLIIFNCLFIAIFFWTKDLKENGNNLESFNKAVNNNPVFSKLAIILIRFICVFCIISSIIAASAQPLYNLFITGNFNLILLQKFILVSLIDNILPFGSISILFISVTFYDKTFTSEVSGFLVTEDNRIIKLKYKIKEIFVPKDLKLFMADTFENCDSSYTIRFEEGTTEIPLLKFKNSIPKIVYPASLVDIRENSLFISKNNPFDNSATVQMLLRNPVFKIIDGCMVNTKSNTLMFVIEHSSSEFKIPESVERIGKYAFDDLLIYKDSYSDEKIKEELELRINKYVNFRNGSGKEYAIYANAACEKRIQLHKVTFNKNIKYVDSDAFEMASGLKEIFVPEDSVFDVSEINTVRPYIKSLGKGKKITHRMIERLLLIHEKIKSGCYPNSKQLAYDLETSEPTINRDIEYLRDSRGAPIQYDFTNRGYYYTENYELFFDK